MGIHFSGKYSPGKKYGRFTIVKFHHRDEKEYFYLCRCQCGTVKTVRQNNLKNGGTFSCGCSRVGINLKHGLCHSSEYRIWSQMKDRCSNKNNKNFQYYGGRGVKVCVRWAESFNNFIKDLGMKPSAQHSIDRIDNDGNYEPGNVRWASRIQQQNNKRNSAFIEYLGEKKTISEWSRKTGIPKSTIRMRIARGKFPLDKLAEKILSKEQSK